MKPLVSVCIPTFNRGHLLQKAIQSVLLQTFHDFEIVVVDDHSQENIENQTLSLNDDRIRYIRNSRNIGMVANFNKCVELAGGEFVSILHTDDYFEPQLLERESNFLSSHDDVAMVYTAYYLAHELSGRKKTMLPYPKDRIFTGTAHFESLIENGNYIAFSSVMVRKAAYQHVWPFQVSLPYTSDLEMWLRLSLHYPVAYLSSPLVTWRFHSDMESFKFFSSGQGVDQEWQAIHLALGQTPWPERERQLWLTRARRYVAKRTLNRAFFHADKSMATVRKHLAKAVSLSPMLRLHPLYWFTYAFSLMGDKSFSILNRVRLSVGRRFENASQRTNSH